MSGVFDLHQISSLEMRHFVGRYISTGNPMIDMVAGIFIFKALLWVTNLAESPGWSHLTALWSLLFGSTKPLHRGQVEYDWSSSGDEDSGRTQLEEDISPQYKAIMYKVAKIDDCRVNKLRECMLTFYGYDQQRDDDGDEYSVWVNKSEIFFECVQKEPVEIQKGVFLTFEEDEKVHSVKSGGQVRHYSRKLCLYSDLFTPLELTQFVDKWVEEYTKEKEMKLVDQQLIFQVRFDSEGAQHIISSPFHTFRNFDNLNFEHKALVLKELEFFESRQDWYEQRGLPHTLGILCHGEPGCGKSSFIKALLQETGRHAVVFSINGFTNLEAIEKLMRTDTIADYPIPQENRVYVLEDIDAMGELVKKRSAKSTEDDAAANAAMASSMSGEKVKKKKTTSDGTVNEKSIMQLLFGKGKEKDSQHLGFLLNLLDGVIESPGRIVVMTTNFVDKLDPALIRPGRIDLRLEFSRCTRSQVIDILALFYELPTSEIQLPAELTDHKITPARLAQICRASKRQLPAAIKRLMEDVNASNPNTNNTSAHCSKNVLETEEETRENWGPMPDCSDPSVNCWNCQMKKLHPNSSVIQQPSSVNLGPRVVVNVTHHHHAVEGTENLAPADEK